MGIKVRGSNATDYVQASGRFSQIWDFSPNCATKNFVSQTQTSLSFFLKFEIFSETCVPPKFFFLNQIKSSKRTKLQRNIWEMQQYFLLLTYSKTIFSLLAEEITSHYHTTSVGFIKIFCNRFIPHNNWQYFELVKKHSWQGSKTGDGIDMYSDQKIHLSYVERNLWTSRRRSTRLPGRKLSAYLTLNFLCILNPILLYYFWRQKINQLCIK